MEFSLELLAERLHWAKGTWQVNHSQTTFREIALYEPGQPLLPGTVYLTNQIEACTSPDTVGFLLILPHTAEFPQTASSRCLSYRTYQSATTVYNQVTRLLSHLSGLITKFQQCAYREKNLQALMGLAYEIFQNPAYLVDSSFRVMAIDRTRGARHLSATWRHMEDDGYVPFDVVSALITSGELGLMETHEDATQVRSDHFYVPFINYNLRHNHRVQGHFFVVGLEKTLGASDTLLANQLGESILFAMVENSHFQHRRGEYHEYFMGDLFSGKMKNQKKICQNMEYLGFSPHDFYTVIAIHPSPTPGLPDERIAHQLERCCGAKPVFYNGNLMAVFAHKRAMSQEELTALLVPVQENLDCQIGVSDVTPGFFALHHCATQATWALEVDACQNIRFYNDFATAHLAYQFGQTTPWEVLVLPCLRNLATQEETAQLDPIHTLHVYLQQERSLQNAANILQIHRNTLVYRIHRIATYCNLDFSDSVTRKRALLSLDILDFYG